LGLQLLIGEQSPSEAISIGEISIGALIVISIFIAPFLETFIYQSLVFGVLGKVSFFSENQVLIILLSAILFGLGHDYSKLYIIYGMLTGLVLAYGYSLFQWRKEGPYLMISALHAFRNLVAVILYITGVK